MELDCDTYNSPFETRQEWIDHVKHIHWTNLPCPECSFTTSDVDTLHQHIACEHALLHSMEDMMNWQRNVIFTPSGCPICQDPIDSPAEYESHVGRHLQELALDALSRVLDGTGQVSMILGLD